MKTRNLDFVRKDFWSTYNPDLERIIFLVFHFGTFKIPYCASGLAQFDILINWGFYGLDFKKSCKLCENIQEFAIALSLK